jgi:hypothetical protein
MFSIRFEKRESEMNSRDSKHCNLLLLEIPPVQVISRRELLVDIPERRRQFESTQEQPDGYSLSSNGCTIHDFEFGDGLRFIVLIWCRAGSFASDDG